MSEFVPVNYGIVEQMFQGALDAAKENPDVEFPDGLPTIAQLVARGLYLNSKNGHTEIDHNQCRVLESDLVWRHTGQPNIDLTVAEAASMCRSMPTGRGLIDGTAVTWCMQDGFLCFPGDMDVENGIVGVYSQRKMTELIYQYNLQEPVHHKMGETLAIYRAVLDKSSNPLVFHVSGFGREDEDDDQAKVTTQFMFLESGNSEQIGEQLLAAIERSPKHVRPMVQLAANLMDKVFGPK